MTITTIQKVIKIGSSRGVTLPAKQLKALGVKDGENVRVVVDKIEQGASAASDKEVVETAEKILEKYSKAFTNLANR